MSDNYIRKVAAAADGRLIEVYSYIMCRGFAKVVIIMLLWGYISTSSQSDRLVFSLSLSTCIVNSRKANDDFPRITFLNFMYIQQEAESAPEQNNKRSPSDFLKAVLGRPVNVRLNTGTDYKGKMMKLNDVQILYIYTVVSHSHHIYKLFCTNVLFLGVLACLDGYMNIAMEQTEEYVDGQLKSKYGDCFIRGNNGM